MEFIVIYCTVPNKKEGKEIAHTLVEHDLIACATLIDKAESIFSWDGEMMEEKEAFDDYQDKERAVFKKVNHIIQKCTLTMCLKLLRSL